MFGCHHDTVWLRRGPQSSRPGQSVPPTDSLGCHRPPLGRSSTTSFPSNNSKKGVLKYQQASRDHGKQLLNLLLLPEHISFLEGEGPSTTARGKVIPSPTSPAHSRKQCQPIHRHCRDCHENPWEMRTRI